jgi:hypothetical protein
MRDVNVRSHTASMSWESRERLIALVLPLLIPACRSPPNAPLASDTVATSGFPQLPLCFTCIWWTAEFGNRELAIVWNQLTKQRPLYIGYL